MKLYAYTDARGAAALGCVESTFEGQGTDVRYFMRHVDGQMDILSGDRLREMAPIPDTINGWPVHKIALRRNGGYVVLIARDQTKADPWVQASWHPSLLVHDEWTWGHYFKAKEEAQEAFDARAKSLSITIREEA